MNILKKINHYISSLGNSNSSKQKLLLYQAEIYKKMMGVHSNFYMNRTDRNFAELKVIAEANLGDMKDRFIYIGDSNQYVYDTYLKGYWSSCSKSSHNYKETLNLLDYKNGKPENRNLGKLWSLRKNSVPESLNTGKTRLPTIFELASLLSDNINSRGCISPVFKDNSDQSFWSINQCETNSKWTLSFCLGFLHPSNELSNCYYRAFSPDNFLRSRAKDPRDERNQP